MQKKEMIKKVHIPIDSEEAAAVAATQELPAVPKQSKKKKQHQQRKFLWLWTVQEENVPRAMSRTEDKRSPKGSDRAVPPSPSPQSSQPEA